MYPEMEHNHNSFGNVQVGASNELPESEELDALFDRFLIRRQVAQVSLSTAQLSCSPGCRSAQACRYSLFLTCRHPSTPAVRCPV